MKMLVERKSAPVEEVSVGTQTAPQLPISGPSAGESTLRSGIFSALSQAQLAPRSRSPLNLNEGLSALRAPAQARAKPNLNDIPKPVTQRKRSPCHAAQLSVDPNCALPVQAAAVPQPVLQARFSESQMERIKSMPRSIRIEYLGRVSDEEWQQFLDSDFFDSFFTGSEEVDEIREERKQRKADGETPSSEWLAPFPAGNAKLAAEQLAFLDATDDTDFEQLLQYRESFLTLVRKKVQIAYLEDLEIEENKPLLRGDVSRGPEFLHPTEDLWLPVPAKGTSLFFLGFIIARKADSVESWRNHLLKGVAISGEDGDAPLSGDDPEMDDLADLMSGLSLDNSLDSRVVPMDIDSVPTSSTAKITRTNYDADGDVIMEDVNGISDIVMTDVHGSMDISFHRVSGFVSMEIEDVTADMDIDISDIDGSLQIVLMDIDLSEDETSQKMEIDIEDVGGTMDIEVSDYDEHMDVDLGHIEPGGYKYLKFNKRKREDLDDSGLDLPKSKRQKLEAQDDPGAASIDDLIGKFSALSISFRTGLDREVHKIYPARNLADLIIASDPTPLKSIIANKKWLNTSLSSKEVTKLKKLKSGVETALANVKNSSSKTNNTSLAAAMKKVALFLSAKGTVAVPDTDLSGSTNHASPSGITSTVVGKKVVANPLSPLSTNPGTVAQDGALMDALRTKVQAAGGKTQDPVQAHMLNMKTWGPGELWNLTPASKQFNSDMESKVETPLKAAIYDKGIVMYFEAEATYNHYPVGLDYVASPEKYLFTKIVFKAYQFHEDTVAGAWVQDATITDDSDVKAVNKTMKWDPGNFPTLLPSPKAHTETVKKPFLDHGFPTSVVEAITSYNANVAVGAAIPGTGKTRVKWPGNVGVATFLGELQVWLDTAKSGAPGCYAGKQKRVASKDKMPANWKQVLDFS